MNDQSNNDGNFSDDPARRRRRRGAGLMTSASMAVQPPTGERAPVGGSALQPPRDRSPSGELPPSLRRSGMTPAGIPRPGSAGPGAGASSGLGRTPDPNSDEPSVLHVVGPRPPSPRRSSGGVTGAQVRVVTGAPSDPGPHRPSSGAPSIITGERQALRPSSGQHRVPEEYGARPGSAREISGGHGVPGRGGPSLTPSGSVAAVSSGEALAVERAPSGAQAPVGGGDKAMRDLVMILKDTRARLEALEKKHAELAAQPAAPAAAPQAGHGEALAGEDIVENIRESSRVRPSMSVRKATDKANRIDRFLELMVKRGASDFHITVGTTPMFRDSGDMAPLRYRRLRKDDWERLLQPMTPPDYWRRFQLTGDADFAYAVEGLGRFRVNLFNQERGGGAVFRLIPEKILTVEQLGLPEQIHKIPRIPGGLVLVTGPTGSGKSTTMAAIINEINETRSYHIITLEDPIEFVHPSKMSLIHQRQIGVHATDFSSALKAAVREDPNLLLVGELRDVETMRLALESAEKGLLVFGTLHTNNAAKTVDRIISSFPPDEQDTCRNILADTLRAVVAQQLLKRIGGGRVAALEILFGSGALSSFIRDGKTHMITNMIQTGRKRGMITMDDALQKLIDDGVITRDAALDKAIDKDRFRDPEQAAAEEQALAEATKGQVLGTTGE
jgi:twitching motility protein PilT